MESAYFGVMKTVITTIILFSFEFLSFGQSIVQNVDFITSHSVKNDSITTLIEQFKLVELGVSLSSSAESDFKFGGRRNPFNENDIEIFGILTDLDSAASRKIYSFYTREFGLTPSGQADRNNDLESKYPFRMRFAVKAKGVFVLRVFVKDSGGAVQLVKTFRLETIPNQNNNQGFIETSGDYLSFSGDSSLFFPIGNGLTFYRFGSMRDEQGRDDPEFPDGTHRDYSSKTVTDFTRLLNDLSNYDSLTGTHNGGNFIRLMLNSYNFDIEWNWSANDPNFNEANVGYHEYLYRAQDFDRILELCEERGIYVMLCLFNHKVWNDKETGPHVHYHWGNNPYRTLPNITSPDDFFTNPTSQKLAKRKVRYIASRWGYHPNLAIFQITNELDISGISIGDFKGKKKRHIENWNSSIAHLVKEIAPFKLITNSVANFKNATVFKDEIYDIGVYHYYSKDKELGYQHANIVNSLRDELEKPIISGELGTSSIRECKGSNGDIPHNPVVHNSIWSTSFSGSLGAGLMYFWEDVHLYPDAAQAIQHYYPLNNFFKNESLNQSVWKPIATNCRTKECLPINYGWNKRFEFTPTGIEATDDEIEVFALKKEGDEKIIGWVHNIESYWFNLPGNKDCGSSTIDVNSLRNHSIGFNGLKCGVSYQVEWWSTHPWYDSDGNGIEDDFEGGKITNDSMVQFTQAVQVNENGVLKLPIPPLEPLSELGVENWAPDYAFKLMKIDSTSSSRCPKSRTEILDSIILNSPETLESYLECYPNPISDGKINIEFFSHESSKLDVLLYDFRGSLMKEFRNQKPEKDELSKLSFSVSDLNSGVYLLLLSENGRILESKRILIY